MKKVIRFFCIGYLIFSFIMMLFYNSFKLNPYQQDLSNTFLEPNKEHIFGLDEFGRDFFSRIVEANKNSLSIAFLSALVALSIGSISAFIASFTNKKIDTLANSINDIILSMPTILIAISLYFVFESQLFSLIFSLGLVLSPLIFKVMRAEIKNIKGLNYIKASLILGTPKVKIFFIHILPELVVSLSIQFGFLISNSIIVESSLSFLGLGIQEPLASFGNILRKSEQLITYPLIPLLTSFFLSILIFSINITTDFISESFKENKDIN